MPIDYTKLVNLEDAKVGMNTEHAMIASNYSSSATYAVGAYAYYAGTLYKCTTAITTAEAWNSAHWAEAKLGNDLVSQSEKIEEFKGNFDSVEPVNLANPALLTMGGFRTGNVGTTSYTYDNSAFAFYKIPVENGKTYCVSGTSYNYKIVDVDDKVVASGGNSSASESDVVITINDTTAKHMYVNFRPATYPTSSYMIVVGSTMPADYSPWFEPYVKFDSEYYAPLQKWNTYYADSATNLMALFDTLKNDESDKIIYVSGVHDVFAEIGGATFAQSIQSGTAWTAVSTFVPPNTKLIGLGSAIIKFQPDAEDIGTVAMDLLSPINMSASNCTIENITILASNCRYAIHDDCANISYWGYKTYEHNYKNIIVKKSGGGYAQAIGGGFTGLSTITFSGCYIESAGTLPFSYHNNVGDYYNGSNTPRITIENCGIKTGGTRAIRFGNIDWHQNRVIVLIINTTTNGNIYLYKEATGDAIKNAYDLFIVSSKYTDIDVDEGMANPYTPDIFSVT